MPLDKTRCIRFQRRVLVYLKKNVLSISRAKEPTQHLCAFARPPKPGPYPFPQICQPWIRLDSLSSGSADREPMSLEPASLDRFFRYSLLDGAYGEMRAPDGSIRPHCLALAKRLATLLPEELLRRKQSTDLSFLSQGIPFTV